MHCCAAGVDKLPEPPNMARRIEEPARVFGMLLALAAFPIATLWLDLDSSAQKSVAHVAISFVVLMVAFRVLGKRELGRLSPFELVTLMLIPEILSTALQGEAPLVPSLAGLSTILFLVLFSSVLKQRLEPAQRAMEASPTLLVCDGQLLQKSMNSERIAPDELFSEMRKQGLQELREVRFAVLESSGNITFVPVERDGRARSTEGNEVGLA